MKFDFDEVVDRHGTGSSKWEFGEQLVARGITDRFDEDTIPLFTADMDFRCPPSVKEEILKVAEHNLYGYSGLDINVTKDYFDAIINWFKDKFDWDITPEEITYVNGTVEAVGVAIKAFTKEGEGVLINRPIYTPFTHKILENNRVVVNSQLINNDGYYTIDFEDFEKKAADENTKLFILCHPHNPTGRVWTDEELIKMYDICTKHGVIVVADEIHGDLVREDVEFHPLATLVDTKNLISLTAANKTFNLAGLQVTNAVITDPAVREQYRETLGRCVPTPFAVAALKGAYNGGDEWLQQLRVYIDGNIDWVLNFLKENMPKVKCTRPEGTYIIWMDFRDYGLTADEVRKKIYVDANVALECGTMFDPDLGEGFERMCLSTRRALIQEAFERIAAQFKDL